MRLMIITAVYDHDARKKSYSLLGGCVWVGEEGGGVSSAASTSSRVTAIALIAGGASPFGGLEG